MLLEVLPLPVREGLLFAQDERLAKRRIGTLEELFKQHPEFKAVLIDATEQETPKPKDKAKRNKPLDFIQKLANQLQNSFRMSVENALAHLKRFKLLLAHLKRFKLLAAIYRGPERSYDDTFLAITGFHNFRKLGSFAW